MVSTICVFMNRMNGRRYAPAVYGDAVSSYVIFGYAICSSEGELRLQVGALDLNAGAPSGYRSL